MSGGDRPLRIAVIGTRGVPATYGGIERHVEELGARLVQRGHRITVFCRTTYVSDRPPVYRGMQLRHLPTINSKSLDAIVHSGLSSLATLGRGYDVVHYHAVGPGLTSPIPRYLGRTPVVLTVHGLDGEREKWGGVGKVALRTGAWLSAHVPAATIVVSQALADHYQQRYGRTAVVIPNGVQRVPSPPAGEVLRRLSLSRGRYALFVGRFVPEKAPAQLVSAFRAAAPPGWSLVLAGGSSHTDDYAAEVRTAAAGDPRVVLPGYVYGDDLSELYANAGLYVQPSLLEGLPLTLLEAASFGVPVLASNIPPHLEILGSDAPARRLFEAGNVKALGDALRVAIAGADVEQAAAGDLRADILRRYSWDAAAAATEATYEAARRR